MKAPSSSGGRTANRHPERIHRSSFAPMLRSACCSRGKREPPIRIAPAPWSSAKLAPEFASWLPIWPPSRCPCTTNLLQTTFLKPSTHELSHSCVQQCRLLTMRRYYHRQRRLDLSLAWSSPERFFQFRPRQQVTQLRLQQVCLGLITRCRRMPPYRDEDDALLQLVLRDAFAFGAQFDYLGGHFQHLPGSLHFVVALLD